MKEHLTLIAANSFVNATDNVISDLKVIVVEGRGFFNLVVMLI